MKETEGQSLTGHDPMGNGAAVAGVGEMHFLEGIGAKSWALISRLAESRPFSPGEILVEQGDTDDALYILQSGQAQVIIEPANTVIATLPTGSVFGEMAFFDQRPRSATVRAMTRGNALRISRDIFDQITAWEPEVARRMLLEMGRVLALRLRWVQQREHATPG